MNLTPRQQEIGRLLVKGMSSKAIGNELGVSEKTVKSQLVMMYARTGCANRVVLAVRLATEAGT